MPRRLPTTLITLAAALALVSCGGGGDSEQETGPITVEGLRVLRVVEIHETEFRFDPATIRLDRIAVYGLAVVNDGKQPHSLEISGPELHRRIGNVQPGESTTIAVFFKEHGDYEIICPLDDHAGKGMRAVITVG